jgi:hypothetical protein
MLPYLSTGACSYEQPASLLPCFAHFAINLHRAS